MQATKKYRSVWLGDIHLHKVKILETCDETIERMIEKDLLTRNAIRKLALSWAANYNYVLFLPCPEATFIDASWGIAHEMPIVWNDEKGETRYLSKQKEFIGNRSAFVDWFVDKRLVAATMANERNWVRNDQNALKMIPSMKVAGNLISMPRVRRHWICSSTRTKSPRGLKIYTATRNRARPLCICLSRLSTET